MMSTSSSQYLQPEYIQPLPSSLDVNSSPLALLAQTCSSIGKDAAGPPSKAGGTGSSGSSDKKAPSQTSGGGSSGGMRSKSESPPVGRSVALCPEERSKSRTSGNNEKKEASHGQRCAGSSSSSSKGTTPKPGFRVPPTPSKEGSSASSLRGGGDRVNIDSGAAACETAAGGRSSREGLLQPPLVPSTVVVGRPSLHGHGGPLAGNAVFAKSTGNGNNNNCSSMLLELNQEAMMNKSSLHGPLHPLYGSLKDGGIQALHGSLAPSSIGALPFLGYPISLDPLAAAAAYSASLAAHCSGLAAAAAAAGLGLSTQKSSAASVPGIVSSTPCSAAAAVLPPYASYVRMKTATGGTTLVPVCKDPYCAHCQVALHGAAQLAVVSAGAGTPCTGSGCGQCTAHGKSSPTSRAASTPTPAGLPFFPPCVSSAALCSHAAFSSAAAGLQGTSPHGGPLVTPYVCNWVQGGDGYCGKRFSSSDDLLQHLRSHTSTAAASDALISPFHTGLPLSAAAAAAMGFPFGGLLGCPALSPGGLLSAPSSYPRSLSPNSLLSAARYHPYKPPPLSVLSGSTPPGLSGAFPSLAAYYSPYAFYGQRVGAAAAVGP